MIEVIIKEDARTLRIGPEDGSQVDLFVQTYRSTGRSIIRVVAPDGSVEFSNGSDRGRWTHHTGDGVLAMRALRRAERIFETLESM